MSITNAKRRYVELEIDEVDDDNRPREVQFASHCQVLEIPHYREYSMEQKNAMWNGRKQLRSMARINTLEYSYDGWDPELACEEDQFVIVNDVPVHPAHHQRSKE